MTYDLTRRTFGLLALGTATATAIPVRVLARTGGYANPHLLVEPEELIPGALPTETLRPVYEADGIIVVDIRPREAFDAGHVPGARHLDPNAVVAEGSPVNGALLPVQELQAMLGARGIEADKRVVLYDDRGGFHAARMFWLLEYLGHRNVALLNGGLTAWVAASGPVTRISADHAPAVFHAAPSARRYASADWVLEHGQDPDHALIDVRPAEVFAKGHIPWAVNVPWSLNLSEDGRFEPADALRAHFEAHGVTADRDVAMHCEVGLASSHSYVALRLLGFPRLRVYHRSWAEWGGDPSLPKATS